MNTNLIVPDPYESVYQFEHQVNPDFAYEYRAMKKSDVRAVDFLLEKVGPRQEVKTLKDWEALEDIFKFYWAQWPQDAKKFYETIPDIRSTRAAGGYSESRETRYLGAIPLLLLKLIKICFPNQSWDKTFSNLFVKRFKLFNVGDQTIEARGKIQI